MDKNKPPMEFPPLPFDSEKFKTAWDRYLAVRKEYRFPTWKPLGMKWAIEDLMELSGGNEEKAILIVNQSRNKGWRGFFKLQNNDNNAQGSNRGTAVIETGKGFGRL